MAVVRARSSPPYGMIVFVCLWVISTALAIVFYINDRSDKVAADNAAEQLKQIGSLPERNQANELFRAAADKTTILGSANNIFGTLRKELTASPNASGGDIERELKDALAAAGKPDKQAIPAIRELAAEKKDFADQLDAQKKLVDNLHAQIVEAGRQSDEARAKLSADLADSQAKRDAALAALQAAEDARNTTVADYEKKITDLNNTADTQRKQLVLENQQLKNENDGLRKRNNDLLTLAKQFRSGDVNNPVVGESDGHILRVNAADKVAWINLGKAERMLPGMPFAVYDPRLGVRVGTTEEALGKAGLEVIEVYDHDSLCRITRTTKGQSIQTGDLISNPVYHSDKARKTRFVIVGDFDLDGDGVATSAERERLIRMIVSWGGIVENNASTQTDYVVVGDKPASPIIQPDENAPAGSPASARASEQSNYDRVVSDAKQLAIPTLNANRFLAMIGYYNTTIVR